MLTEEHLQSLANIVQEELFDILGQINYSFKLCRATTYLGQCNISKSEITITKYLEDDQTIKNVIAHELIHAYGVNNHGKDFVNLLNKINECGKGYTVVLKAKNGNIGDLTKLNEVRKQRKVKQKEYIIWCPHCGWIQQHLDKRKLNLKGYRCPHCRRKGLKSKIFKQGVRIGYKG